MMDRFAQRMLPVIATMAAISSAPTIARAADPAPHINYLDVNSAAETSFVGIYGRGFGTQEGRVQFAGAASKDIALWTDNLIIARVPIGAQSGKLTLTSSDGNAKTEWPVTFRVRAGHVYVVSSNGSDSDSGTEDAPFQSLYKARSVAKAGDTVMVRAGTYDEENSGSTPGPALNITVGGSSSSPITWRGFGKELPVIRGTGTKAADSPILYAGGSNLRFARLIVDGKDNHDSAVWIHGSSVWMTGVEVRNFTKTGVGIDEVPGVVLVNNHIHDGTTNPGLDHGIWMLGRQGTIRGNLVEDLPYGDGIRLEYSTQSSSNVFGNYVANIAGPGIALTRVGGGNRVYNNVLWKTGQTEGCRCALEVGYESDDGKVGQGDHIYFNTIVGPTYRGVFTAQRQAPVQLNSNLFANVQGGIIFDDQASQDAMSCSHNLWSATSGHELLFQWDGSTKTFDEFQKASSKASGSFTADPALVDAENGDAHLTASSPAVDKAGGPDKTTLDFDGVSRPQGAASDIGAFELANGSAAGAGGTGGSAGEGGSAGNASSGGEAGNAAGGQAQGGSAQAGSAGESGGDSAGGSSDGGGCGCSVPGHRNSIPEGWLLLGAAVAATMLRRRAR